MITKNAMQFKAIIKKTAKDKGISPQLVMQNLGWKDCLKEYLYPIIVIILFSKGDFLSPLL